ncbi:MAG TPA: hypothetical protein VHM90_10420 [Phycisphaerae bacterium]|nr:hypothetical protein [Phycisphaerae bacterium]
MTRTSDSEETGGEERPSRAARKVQGLADAPPIVPRRRRNSRGARWRKRIIMLLILAAAGTAGAYYGKPMWDKAHLGASDKDGPANIQTYTVKRGPLRISIVEEGKLRAVKSYPVIFGVNGKITYLVEAGSKVKKGDLVASLDKKQYDERRALMVTDLETQKAALAVAEQAVPIAKSNADAAVAAAVTKAEEAALALKTYQSIEAPKKLSEFENQLNESRTKLSDATKKKTEAQSQLDEKLLDEGEEKKSMEQQIDLQKQTISSLQKVQAALESERKLYKAYTYPQDIKSKQQALANAQLEVTKAQTTASSEMLQKEADVKKARSLMDHYAAEIKEIDDNISKCSAFAPADGLVFYGSEEMMRYGDINDRIRVGSEWYSDGPIMTIPDLSAFQVAVSIAEVYRGRVTTGMPATVTVEAVPGLVLNGSLATVASVARNKIPWDSSSPQVFDATLSLSQIDPRMVQGMTVKVEVTTAEFSDVLTVPIEAVFNEGGKPAVFKWVEAEGKSHAEKWPVQTGQVNDHFVEIKMGLNEGDHVLLSRPMNFVTPRNYRELADAVAPPPDPVPASVPASSAAKTQAAEAGMMPAASAPAVGPASAPAGAAASAPAPDEALPVVVPTTMK